MNPDEEKKPEAEKPKEVPTEEKPVEKKETRGRKKQVELIVQEGLLFVKGKYFAPGERFKINEDDVPDMLKLGCVMVAPPDAQ